MSCAPATMTEALRSFNPACRRAIRDVVQRARAGQPPLACFDADGTIWAEDIGEGMLRWLAAGGLLPGTRAPWTDVWAEYEARVREDRCAGYAWAVATMEGLREDDVMRWSRQFAAAWPNYRPQMVGLLQGLHGAGVEVVVVTDTNRWLVEAAVERMGLPALRVLGIETRVRDGVLTGEVVQPVTCRAGKVEAIRLHLNRMPDLAVGDSVGDLEMLDASGCAVVVGRRSEPRSEMVRLARARGWPVQWF